MNSLIDGSTPPPNVEAESTSEGKWRTIDIGYCGFAGCAAQKSVRDLIGLGDNDLLDITITRDGVPEDETVVRVVHKVPKAILEMLKQTKNPIIFLGGQELEFLGLKPQDLMPPCKCGKCPPRETSTQVIKARVRVSEDVVECP